MCDPRSHTPPPAARPCWGLLYGGVLAPLIALGAVEVAAPPNPARTALRYLLALGAMAGMAAWLRGSRPALDLAQWCACAASTVTVRVIESRRPSRPGARLRAVTPDEDDSLVLGGAQPADR